MRLNRKPVFWISSFILTTCVLGLCIFIFSSAAISRSSYESARERSGDQVLIIVLDSRSRLDKGLPDSLTLFNFKSREVASLSREWTYSIISPSETLVSKYLGQVDCEPFCNIQGVFAFSQTSDAGDARRIEAIEKVRTVVSQEYEIPNLAVVALDLTMAKSFLENVGPVELVVKEKTPIGGKMIEGRLTNFRSYLNPGRQVLEGPDLFWFARARAFSDNQDRMERQRRLLQSLMAQKTSIELFVAALRSDGFAISDLSFTEILQISMATE